MSTPICQLRVLKVEMRVLPMRTRFPFRYGIASLTALPHLFVMATVEVDGREVTGISSEGLAPKWFTKYPETSMEQDLAEMLAVIQNGCRLSQVLTQEPRSYYELWLGLQTDLGHWARQQGHPGLLWQLGVSIVERAVLDAVCKAKAMPLHEVLRAEMLGVPWEELLPGMGIASAGQFLPESPLESCWVRHTVGLADPLRTSDIPEEERLHDGLPQSLEENIRAYGLRYFKIKLWGDYAKDHARLRVISGLLKELCGDEFVATLDGNENFRDIAAFRADYERLQADESIQPLLERTLWVEQPLHRDHALDDGVAAALAQWQDAPPMIIDESDGESGAVQRALDLGYVGTSHKNCKGILKGLLNAARIHHARQLHPGKGFFLSGEDLVNVGPVALLQDLAMQALLGVQHLERNGHHYFRGLSMHAAPLVDKMLEHHGDLYRRSEEAGAVLSIADGRLALGSVNAAPFGCGIQPDLSALPSLKEWIMQGGMQGI